MVRVPALETTSTEPPSNASTTGISAAASACTIEPTVVPRLRIVPWATWASARDTNGCTRRTSAEARTSACRARAPIRTPAPVASMPARSGTALMSTSRLGAASRMDSSGTRLCPPASTLASGSSARAAAASASDPGRR